MSILHEPGVGVDILAWKKFAVRAEHDYQFWPSLFGPNPLNPYGAPVRAVYDFGATPALSIQGTGLLAHIRSLTCTRREARHSERAVGKQVKQSMKTRDFRVAACRLKWKFLRAESKVSY